MDKVRVGKVYRILHFTRGEFTARIKYIGRLATYATIVDPGTTWTAVKVGEDVRLTRGLIRIIDRG